MAKIDTGRDDYISAIYELIEKKEIATNKKISEILGVKAASVSEMLKKLTEEGEVYTENKSILLTETGKMRARALLTKHRLWELFLVEYLGYSWQDVHEDAKALEYVTSNGLKDRLNEFLNKPMHCPHGNEIYENHPETDKLKKLSEVSKGISCRLHKVEDDRDLIEYLEEKKILDPRDTYANVADWEIKAKDLASRFAKNFKKYETNEAGKALVAAGPKVD